MGAVYLASLIIGLGILLLQLFMSSDKDLDASSETFDATDPALTADAGADVHPSPAHSADHHSLSSSVFDVGSVATLFVSFRFWTFALAAFGTLGSFLHYTGFGSFAGTLMASLLVALVCGLGASWTFRYLGSKSLNSGAGAGELVGQIGKVLLPPNTAGRAKVRLYVKGQVVDYLATTDDRSLELGTSVLVVEVRGNQLHVSAAPAGLKYSDD